MTDVVGPENQGSAAGGSPANVQAGETIRLARRNDLDAIVALLTDDDIARSRGNALAPSERVSTAFDDIQRDANNELWITERHSEPVAVLQLTFIPGLSRGGMRRAQVEAVRVRRDLRGQGVGARLMQYVIERAREQGCGLLQLTSDLRRRDAHRFYQRLGFVASHAGMKLDLRTD
jgi:GNAT superfamily N-acetyltransferase